jgi:hypothetical protein
VTIKIEGRVQKQRMIMMSVIEDKTEFMIREDVKKGSFRGLVNFLACFVIVSVLQQH